MARSFAASLRFYDLFIDRCAFKDECCDGARPVGGAQRVFMADVLARAQEECSFWLFSYIGFIGEVVLRNGLGDSLEAVFCGLVVGGMTFFGGGLDSFFFRIQDKGFGGSILYAGHIPRPHWVVYC